ncbi:MAG: hypothetical protein WBF48_01200 [Halarcobacter sp.]
MKYLLLLAKTSIYGYAQKDAYPRLHPYKENFNNNLFNKKLFIKVFNGIINFKFTKIKNQ